MKYVKFLFIHGEPIHQYIWVGRFLISWDKSSNKKYIDVGWYDKEHEKELYSISIKLSKIP